MASGTTPIETGLGEIYRQMVVNMGGTAPTSLGGGEVLNAVAKAFLSFTPPSLNDVVSGPAGSTAQTYARAQIDSNSATAASGVLNMTAIALPNNLVVNSLNLVTGTTAAITPTHQWAGLYNASRVLLAISADETTAAMAASTIQTYPIATIAQGAAASFTTTYTGLYYVGIVVVAGTQPTWQGLTATDATPTTLPPILAGTSTGSLTTPSAFPTTAGVITPTAQQLYAFTS